jgi:hypothetical protein
MLLEEFDAVELFFVSSTSPLMAVVLEMEDAVEWYASSKDDDDDDDNDNDSVFLLVI